MPSKEANTTNVWHLKISIYSLGDASHKWYNRVKTYLLSIGLVMSKAELALSYYNNNNLIYMIAIYVMTFYGQEQMTLKHFILKLQNMFMIQKENQAIFQYLGKNLMENNSKNFIDHINYAENLKPINYIQNITDFKDLLQFHTGKLL